MSELEEPKEFTMSREQYHQQLMAKDYLLSLAVKLIHDLEDDVGVEKIHTGPSTGRRGVEYVRTYTYVTDDLNYTLKETSFSKSIKKIFEYNNMSFEDDELKEMYDKPTIIVINYEVSGLIKVDNRCYRTTDLTIRFIPLLPDNHKEVVIFKMQYGTDIVELRNHIN